VGPTSAPSSMAGLSESGAAHGEHPAQSDVSQEPGSAVYCSRAAHAQRTQGPSAKQTEKEHKGQAGKFAAGRKAATREKAEGHSGAPLEGVRRSGRLQKSDAASWPSAQDRSGKGKGSFGASMSAKQKRRLPSGSMIQLCSATSVGISAYAGKERTTALPSPDSQPEIPRCSRDREAGRGGRGRPVGPSWMRGEMPLGGGQGLEWG